MIYNVERCLSGGFRLRLIIGCRSGLCLSIRCVGDTIRLLEIEAEFLLYSLSFLLSMNFELRDSTITCLRSNIACTYKHRYVKSIPNQFAQKINKPVRLQF